MCERERFGGEKREQRTGVGGETGGRRVEERENHHRHSLLLLLYYSRVRSSPALRAMSPRFASRRETVSVVFCFGVFCCCCFPERVLRQGRGFRSFVVVEEACDVELSILPTFLTPSHWPSLVRGSFLLLAQEGRSQPASPEQASSKRRARRALR